jgi:hypothetical protein
MAPQVVTTLTDRRARLAGQVRKLEEQLGQARANLIHIDAVIRIFDPAYNPELIAPKETRERSGWFENGEMPRLVLDTLRAAREPLTVRQISLAIAERRGFDPADKALLTVIDKRVDRSMRRHKRELLEKIGAPGVVGRWRIRAEDGEEEMEGPAT